MNTQVQDKLQVTLAAFKEIAEYVTYMYIYFYGDNRSYNRFCFPPGYLTLERMTDCVPHYRRSDHRHEVVITPASTK